MNSKRYVAARQGAEQPSITTNVLIHGLTHEALQNALRSSQEQVLGSRGARSHKGPSKSQTQPTIKARCPSTHGPPVQLLSKPTSIQARKPPTRGRAIHTMRVVCTSRPSAFCQLQSQQRLTTAEDPNSRAWPESQAPRLPATQKQFETIWPAKTRLTWEQQLAARIEEREGAREYGRHAPWLNAQVFEEAIEKFLT